MPGMLRWLICAFTALALLAQPVAAVASAGLQGDVTCCCPKPEDCTCHDHKGASHDQQKMRRCGDTSPHTLIAPMLMAALPAPQPPMLIAPARVLAPVVVPLLFPADRPIELETPPF